VIPLNPSTLRVDFKDDVAMDADLGSRVSEAYYDKTPFKFTGKIEQVQMTYTK
jgi:hypothetical protein